MQNDRSGCRDFPETERGRHNKFLCCICVAFDKMNGITLLPTGTQLFKLVVFLCEIQIYPKKIRHFPAGCLLPENVAKKLITAEIIKLLFIFSRNIITFRMGLLSETPYKNVQG